MEEVAAKLKIASKDTAARWCLNHGLKIFILGKKRAVIEYEFDVAFEKPIIDHLTRKYRDRWRDYYDAYDSEDVKNFYTIESNALQEEPTIEKFDNNKFFKRIKYERP